MEKKTILVAEHIDKRFGITHAVNDVSLTIAAGEIRGLIGENGSGKSTFCQMLCGIYTIGGGSFTLISATRWTRTMPGSRSSCRKWARCPA